MGRMGAEDPSSRPRATSLTERLQRDSQRFLCRWRRSPINRLEAGARLLRREAQISQSRFDGLWDHAIACESRCSRYHLDLGDRVQPRLQLDDDLGRGAGAHAVRSSDRGRILADNGALQDLEARCAEDVEADLRPDSVNLDQHLEKLQLLYRGEPIQGELIFADNGMDMQLVLSAWRWQLLPRGRAHADEVAHAANVKDDKIGSRPANHTAEMRDH